MNLHLISAKYTVCLLFCICSSLWLISCGMRTAPVFIPGKKEKQTITDLIVQHRDNRVRLSWKINQTERINRLKDFDAELEEGDYFLIHQKLIQLDCRECNPIELPDLKVIIPSDSLIHDGNQLFYYLQFPKNVLKIHSFQITHFGPDGAFFSQSKSVKLRRSNVFPKLPVPELEIIQIEDQTKILRFPFGKVLKHKKNKITDGLKINQFKEKEKKEKSEEIKKKLQSQTEFRLFTLRISWSHRLNQSFNGFTGKGDYFEGLHLYRNHLYRTQNREIWPETPINIKSASENYFLDIHKMQINTLTPPLLVDTHPEILPPRIPFYIDFSAKYLDTWHYKLRLVDRFGNESEASKSVSFNLPKTSIFSMNCGKLFLVPHTN